MARRKLEYHNWQQQQRMSNSSVNKRDSSFERYKSNRRRRLEKEKSAENKDSIKIHSDKEQSKSVTRNDEGHQTITKCPKCNQKLIPPYQVYVCQNQHVHRERKNTPEQQNIQVLNSF